MTEMLSPGAENAPWKASEKNPNKNENLARLKTVKENFDIKKGLAELGVAVELQAKFNAVMDRWEELSESTRVKTGDFVVSHDEITELVSLYEDMLSGWGKIEELKAQGASEKEIQDKTIEYYNSPVSAFRFSLNRMYEKVEVQNK